MMKQSILNTALGCALLLAACGNPPQSNEVTSSEPVAMPATTPGQQASPSNIVNMNQPATGTQPGVATQAGTPQQAPTQTIVSPPVQQKATASSAAGANPAHGQPGHRCDIPVGAPLNSPAGAKPQQPQQQQVISNNVPVQQPVGPQITPIQSAPSPTSAKGKINPAHGEPGHSCAVPVGAPLN